MKRGKEHLTGIPAILAIALGVLCPLCLIAPLLLSAGLGSILVIIVPWLKPLLILVLAAALIGFGISFRVHKNSIPILLTIASGGLMYYGNYVSYNPNLTYLGGFLILTAVISDFFLRSKAKECLECKIDPDHNGRR